MTDKEIRESVNRAFKQIGEEQEERAQARKSSADNARARMIKRQASRGRKDENVGWSKPQIWSN